MNMTFRKKIVIYFTTKIIFIIIMHLTIARVQTFSVFIAEVR